MNKSNRVNGFYGKVIKRGLDFILSLIALIVLSPFLLVTALLVRIKLGSPVIFKQERPGRHRKIFKLYKFRSMSNARDKDGKLLPDTQRLTKFGRILRAMSLDELPELVNILKGDMSIVGPRPLAVSYLPYYTNKENHRHDVRPGLTGLAQVSGRNSISWDAKFKYDIEYIKNLSFINDVKIVLLTVKKVFVREGIGQGEQHPGNLYDVRADWLDGAGKIKPEYQDDSPI
ncbi:MAG: sugar transferase [Sphaerochaeta sp.]|jgi:lipopolysaccharide/colanic/teichoic acid biosynthesis glycosyltransferase|nr:sugar transferase [Sphaerochaeta sp.]